MFWADNQNGIGISHMKFQPPRSIDERLDYLEQQRQEKIASLTEAAADDKEAQKWITKLEALIHEMPANITIHTGMLGNLCVAATYENGKAIATNQGLPSYLADINVIQLKR